MRTLACGLLAAIAFAFAAPAAAEIERRDFHVTTADQVRIHVREVADTRKRGGAPLILIHGARVSGIGSFDLPIANGSLAADLAERSGRPVYVMDARGYGGSDRAAAMAKPAADSRPLSRAYEVVRDVDAVVNAVRRKGEPVALLGWATGGMWGLSMRRSIRKKSIVWSRSMRCTAARPSMRCSAAVPRSATRSIRKN